MRRRRRQKYCQTFPRCRAESAVAKALAEAGDVGVYPPQQDSRLLVDTMHLSGLIPRRRVLDLCTGSGFVAIAAAEMGCASVTAFDICPRAVRCSRGNAAVAGVEVEVREGSWIGALSCEPFEVVVSNPPYIVRSEIDSLEPEIRDFEPRIALDGGGDGLAFFRRIVSEAGYHLREGGLLALEVGAGQDDAVKEILAAAGFADIDTARDLDGIARVVSARR